MSGGLVTYSDVARMEFNLTRLPDRGEDKGVRAHLADILPDKYRLLASRGQPCLLCGVTRALEVLGPDKQGGALVILSRGGPVSAGERAKLTEYAEYYQVRVSSLLVPGTGAAQGDNISTDLARLTDSQAVTVSGGPVSRSAPLCTGSWRWGRLCCMRRLSTEQMMSPLAPLLLTARPAFTSPPRFLWRRLRITSSGSSPLPTWTLGQCWARTTPSAASMTT